MLRNKPLFVESVNPSHLIQDFPDDVERELGGRNLFTYLRDKARELKNKIKEKVKGGSLAPSRCRLGNAFCEGSCHAVGSVTGYCNEDFSDCTCSEEKVSAKQYAVCLKEGICSLCCQKQGFNKGECRGPTGWDCKCVRLEEGEEGEGRNAIFFVCCTV